MDASIKVDHIGIAVESIEQAEPILLALGCEKITQDTNHSGQFVWASYRLGNKSGLELIQPVEGVSSFLHEYLKTHGPGLHHVTLEVSDLEEVVEILDNQGIKIVDHRTHPSYSEAFLSPSNPTGALFQLVEFRHSKERSLGTEPPEKQREE